ncbi:DNA binding protein with HTH domain [Ensifer adhaerens]|nr:DNA binding protein with HTH domain [Ensifer adhaerens]
MAKALLSKGNRGTFGVAFTSGFQLKPQAKNVVFDFDLAVRPGRGGTDIEAWGFRRETLGTGRGALLQRLCKIRPPALSAPGNRHCPIGRSYGTQAGVGFRSVRLEANHQRVRPQQRLDARGHETGVAHPGLAVGAGAAYLAPFNLGLKSIPVDRRRLARDRETRLLAIAYGLIADAETDLKGHDGLALERGRRTSSKLPKLIELVMAKPLVSAGMVVKTLEVALRTVVELGLREMTGRGVSGVCRHVSFLVSCAPAANTNIVGNY